MKRGLVAGTICFLVTSSPWLFISFFYLLSEARKQDDIANSLRVLGIFVATSTLFGISVARKSKIFIVLSSIIAIIPTAYIVIRVIIHNI